MEAIEAQIVQFLQQLMQSIGWAGVVVAMAVESANIPLPSEVTMPLAGWMLVQAQGLSVWHTLWAGFWGAVGNTLGSLFNYWLGAWGGRPFLEKYGKYFLISQHDIELGDRWFQKYGEATAFFSRLLPVVRTFISLPAGIAHMNLFRFTFFTFVGSFLWSWVLAVAGYYLGENWQEVRALMRPFDIPIIIILFILFAGFVWHRLRSPKRVAEQRSPQTAGEGEQPTK